MPFPAMLQCAQCCTQLAAVVGLCFIGGDVVSVVPLIPKTHSRIPQRFPKDWCKLQPRHRSGPMDPGSRMGLFSVQEVCGKGPVDSGAKQKKRRACWRCVEGRGGQAPLSVSVRAIMGRVRPQPLTFFILLGGGGVRGWNLPYGHHNDQPRTDRCNHT